MTRSIRSKLAIALLSTVSIGIVTSHAFAVDVGVVWQGKSSMASTILSGIQEQLAESNADIKLEVMEAVETQEDLDKAVKAFETSKQGIIVLRSNGSAYLAGNQPSIPTFIGGGNHPEALGVMKDMKAPEGNITGVTYALPLEGPLQSFMSITPEVSSFLLLSQTNYPSSPIDWKGTKSACEALEIECAQAFAASRDELIKVVEENVGKYDAFILGNQSTVFSNADAVVSASGGKPVFSYAEKGVAGGALGGIVADDRKLGHMLAKSVVSVLIDQKSIKSVPVKMDDEPRVIINMTAVGELGIDLPADIFEIAEFVE